MLKNNFAASALYEMGLAKMALRENKIKELSDEFNLAKEGKVLVKNFAFGSNGKYHSQVSPEEAAKRQFDIMKKINKLEAKNIAFREKHSL
jgi:hypothetical protein